MKNKKKIRDTAPLRSSRTTDSLELLPGRPAPHAAVALPPVGAITRIFAVAIGVIGPLSAAIGAYYITLTVQFPDTALVPFFVTLAVLVAAAILVAFAVHKRLTNALCAWLQDPSGSMGSAGEVLGVADLELAAWRQGLNYPFYVSITVSLCGLAVSVGSAAEVALQQGDLRLTAHVAVGGLLATVIDTIVVWLYTQRSLRPVVKSMALSRPLLPVSGSGIIRLSLATKMMIIITGASVASAVVSGTLAFRGAELALATGNSEWLALRIAGVTIVSLAICLSGCLLIARQTTIPLEELAAMLARLSPERYRERALPSTSDEVGELMSAINQMLEGLEEREHIKDALHRYVSPEVSEVVLRGGVELGGELVYVTILMCDIREFTPMAETLPPRDVVKLLNRFFTAMVEECMERGGFVDKYIGDALMVVFGAPRYQAPAESALRAAQAALGMSVRLSAVNASLAKRGLPAIHIGIGVHAGEVVAGNIGSPRRLNYTVIGDAVNVASRIEGSCKTLGERILISEVVAEHLGNRAELGSGSLLNLKGRAQPIQVFPLRGLAGEASEAAG